MQEVRLVLVTTPSDKQAKEISQLQKICFTDVDDDEAEDDFYHPQVIQVLAYSDDVLVGWAGVHITEQMYNDQKIKIGGYGICTHPQWQRQGVASRIVAEIMKYLKDNNCDIGFLSVNPDDEGSVKLHTKYGFEMMSQHFSWTDSKGTLKQDTGGMIAPINSDTLFDMVAHGHVPLYVGNGYW